MNNKYNTYLCRPKEERYIFNLSPLLVGAGSRLAIGNGYLARKYEAIQAQRLRNYILPFDVENAELSRNSD